MKQFSLLKYAALLLIAAILATDCMKPVLADGQMDTSADTQPAVVASKDAEAQADAENLSAKCRYSGPCASEIWLLNNAAHRLDPGKQIDISWKSDIPVKQLYLRISFDLVPYRVVQSDAEGNILSEEEGKQHYNNLYELDPNAVRVSIVAEEKTLIVCSAQIFGEGTVPGYHEWEEIPEKLDYLVVATHPDDDILFLGAVIPIYGGQQGRAGMEVLTCSKSRKRFDEALNGCWTLGLRTEPKFLAFPDFNQTKDMKRFPTDELVLRLVRTLRQYRPEVVVTQDENGEYGHIQHRVTVQAVKDAVLYAKDETYDPESVEAYGTWEVKKLYLHLYAENAISLDVLSPLENMGGRSAWEVAQEAFQCHISQVKKDNHHVTNEGVYDLSAFGLYYTTVGADTPGVNDMFEHIDAAVLHSK